MVELDARFFKPFIEGTLNTLKIQCELVATHEKPFLKGQREQPNFAIAAVIGLTSSAFNGTITLCFPEKVFLGVMGKMLGESYTEINQEVQDGVAELLNIIFGQAKSALSLQGYVIQKAIPTVIRGNNLHTRALTSGPIMVLPFQTDLGEFQVEICSEASL